MNCWLCGFATTKGFLVAEEDGLRMRCKSKSACLHRLSSKPKHRIRLSLEASEYVAPKRIPDRVPREVRHQRYRKGLCTECGKRPYSAGRPRCNPCHDLFIEWRRLGYGA